MTARTPQRQQLMDLLGPVISSQGYDLEDVSVSAAGRRSLIRVIVDGEHGIDLDAVASVSRAVSDVLDQADDAEFGSPFVLEVSSPGVDRPLSEPRHWRRAHGRLVSSTVSGQPVTGRVKAADDDAVTLEIDGVARNVAWSDLGPGHIQVEFARADSLVESDEERA
jgi:ribosome maturation factor RimP